MIKYHSTLSATTAHRNFYHLISFKLLHVHGFLVFELAAVGEGDNRDGVSRFHGLSLRHDLRHDLATVVTQTIPEMAKKGS